MLGNPIDHWRTKYCFNVKQSFWANFFIPTIPFTFVVGTANEPGFWQNISCHTWSVEYPPGQCFFSCVLWLGDIRVDEWFILIMAPLTITTELTEVVVNHQAVFCLWALCPPTLLNVSGWFGMCWTASKLQWGTITWKESCQVITMQRGYQWICNPTPYTYRQICGFLDKG